MKLHRMMGIEPETRVVALTGGGGKTTSLLALAAEARDSGLRAAVLTTTHIFPPRRDGFELLLSDDFAAAERAWDKGLAVAAGKIAPDGRLLRPAPGMWDYLLRKADAVYVEADGSRGLPLKYPAAWEPALPQEAEQVLLLCGLSALDKPLDEYCHRAELARQELGLAERLIDEDAMERILSAGYGRFRPTVIINQADTEALAARGRKLARLLAERGLNSSAVLSLHNVLDELGYAY